MLVVLHGLQPSLPSATWSWVWPSSVMLQNLGKANHPWRKLNIDIRKQWSKEERALRVRNLDNLRNLGLQLLGILDLLIEVLGLKEMVERRDDVSIDLYEISSDSSIRDGKCPRGRSKVYR